MPTAENAKLQFEGGQNSYPMEALSDSGDAVKFTSNAELFSGASGAEPDIKPDGLATGGAASVAVSSGNDVIDVASLTAYIGGALKTVSASADFAITRAATDKGSVSSITVTTAGAIVEVVGTISLDNTVNDVRGSAGGPPLIPVGSVEIAQVRTTTNVAGVILSTEIFDTIGVHKERYDSPLYSIDSANAEVNFNSALPSIHVGALPKGVFASYADPIFTDIDLASDFVPSENSHSVSSTQVYSAVIGSSSSSLSQGTFTAFLNDGITDALVKAKDDNLWFKFFPDKYKTPYILDQGKLGMARAFPAGDQLSSACTISASSASVGVEA